MERFPVKTIPVFLALIGVFILPSNALSLPDLKITVTPEVITDTYQVKFHVKVTNVGNAPAEPSATAYKYFDVLLFPNHPTQPQSDAPGIQLPLIASIPPEIALAPGEPNSWEYTFPTYDYEVAGTYHWWAMVDSISFSKDATRSTMASRSVSIVACEYQY